MKRVMTIVFIFLSYSLFGQQVNITGFNVKPELPGNINNWGPDAVNAVAIGSAQTRPDAKFKMVVQVRSGSGTVCGNTPQTAQLIDNFNTKALRTGDITPILDNCILRPGQYNLCIQFFNEDLRVVSEQCRPFIVREENMNCAAPQNITPSNEMKYTEQQLLLPLIFRWTPMISSNRNLVVYHFTLWEVEEGETVSQAVYNSLPIFEQDVRGLTQLILRPGILEKRSGTYAWRIEAFDEQGKPFCKENYISAATSFSIEVKKQEKETNCIDFEQSTSTRNWYSYFVDEIRIAINPLDMVNRTATLKLKDGSGGSNAINNVEFSGNWLERGCLCFDYKVDYNPNADKDCPEAKKAGNVVNISLYTGPAITDINSLINSTRAIYVLNAGEPKIEDNVWKKYCLPIGLCKDGNLPSDGKGHWQIHKNGVVITGAEACREWDNLIRNITGLIFGTDYNCEPSEIVYFDNFCWGCPETILPEKNCIDFEQDTITNGWYSHYVTSREILSNSRDEKNHTNVLKLVDGSFGGGWSVAMNNQLFSGNWLGKGCLCFDYKIDWKNTVTTSPGNAPRVMIYTGPNIVTYNDYLLSTKALFIGLPSSPPLQDNVWGNYCLPVAKCSGSQLPSNLYGTWQVWQNNVLLTGAAACVAWNNIVQNVTGLILATDYNEDPRENLYFDNFCWGCPDSISTPPSSIDSLCNYCVDSLKINVGTQSFSISGDVLNIAQAFNILPTNISKISAEMIYLKDDPLAANCYECVTDQSSIGKFVPVNTTSWNSGPLLNGSPVTSTGYFPSKRVIWFCNSQGNLQLNLKISLPGMINSATCKRRGKICIRFSFTDANCKTCEKVICYNYKE